MKTILSFIGITALFINYTYGQLTLEAELRPRYGYLHGYKTVYSSGDLSSGITQRSRLNMGFKKDKLLLKLVVQDIRTWGDVRTLNLSDDHFSIHEAWGEVLFSDKISLKLGRQELNYDDQRIFGSVNWAQQGRSHDVALFKINPVKNTKFHFGFAINEDKVNVAPYKYMQYLWFHSVYEKFNFSILFLNNGVESAATGNTHYGQTLGTHFNTNLSDKTKLSGSFYYQFGKDVANRDISAMEYKIDAKFLASQNWTALIGYEHLSGTGANDTKNKSFNPLYGTNHKFNGWMDYFYVGNHINNVGLNDFNAGLIYKENKFSAGLFGHYFTPDAKDMLDASGNPIKLGDLGIELDFFFNYKFSKDISFRFDQGFMFSNDLDILKGKSNLPSKNNLVTWITVHFKPTLFKSGS